MKSKKRDKSKRKELPEEENAPTGGEMEQKQKNGPVAPGGRSVDCGAENETGLAQIGAEASSNGADSGPVTQEEGKRTKLFWIFDYALMQPLMRPVQTACDSLWRPISYVANLVISFCMDLFFGRARLERVVAIGDREVIGDE